MIEYYYIMPRRNVVFTSGEIYHVFNRTVGKERVFSTLSHLHRISEIVNYYRFSQRLRYSQYRLLKQEARHEYISAILKTPQIVEIYTFSFMPNHFHFLLKQTREFGIKSFISNIQNSFAKYFNIRYDRHGTLFQNSFRGAWIESDEQCLHVSRYIHLNHVTEFIVPFERLSSYPFSSFPNYVGADTPSWVNTKFILSMFPSREHYISFVADQVEYQRALAKLKHVLLE